MIAIGPAGFMAGPKSPCPAPTPELDEEAIGRIRLTPAEANLLVRMATSLGKTVFKNHSEVSSRIANALVKKGFATADKKAGSWTITAEGQVRCKSIY